MIRKSKKLFLSFEKSLGTRSGIFKVIIHKSGGEVSLVEQKTIENVSTAYLKFIIIFLRKNLNFFHLHFLQLFSADTTIFKKKKIKPTKS